ncbi:unnamed protein product, partial [Allacma fusca]
HPTWFRKSETRTSTSINTMDFFTFWIALTAYISLAGFAMFGGLVMMWISGYSDIISITRANDIWIQWIYFKNHNREGRP